MLRDIGAWLSAVAHRWLWLAGGAAATLAQWVWHPTTRALVPVAVACVFVAVFLAWRDEHRKAASQASAAQLEEQRRLKALADKMVDEYVVLARPRRDAGPHALATLGLHALKSDALIREAIQDMDARSSLDPWSGQARHVEDVDLVRFFAWVHDTGIDFLRGGTVEDTAKQVKAAGGHRPVARAPVHDAQSVDRDCCIPYAGV